MKTKAAPAFFPIDLVAQLDYEALVKENNRLPEPQNSCVMCGNDSKWDIFCSQACKKDFYGV